MGQNPLPSTLYNTAYYLVQTVSTIENAAYYLVQALPTDENTVYCSVKAQSIDLRRYLYSRSDTQLCSVNTAPQYGD